MDCALQRARDCRHRVQVGNDECDCREIARAGMISRDLPARGIEKPARSAAVSFESAGQDMPSMASRRRPRLSLSRAGDVSLLPWSTRRHREGHPSFR